MRTETAMDIVERLIAYKDRQRSRKDRDLMSDAANEIERLRAALQKIASLEVTMGAAANLAEQVLSKRETQ